MENICAVHVYTRIRVHTHTHTHSALYIKHSFQKSKWYSDSPGNAFKNTDVQVLPQTYPSSLSRAGAEPRTLRCRESPRCVADQSGLETTAVKGREPGEQTEHLSLGNGTTIY